MHALTGTSGDFDIQINRTFTRAIDVYTTFATGTSGTIKDVANFYCPNHQTGEDKIKTYIAVGDRRFSMFDRHGNAELFQRLLETLGLSQSFQGVSFDRAGFDEYNCVLAFDLEKVSQAQGRGLNVSHGQLMRIHCEGVGNATANYPQKADTTVRYDAILELTSTGASLHT